MPGHVCQVLEVCADSATALREPDRRDPPARRADGRLARRLRATVVTSDPDNLAALDPSIDLVVV
jgi:hypothetical protein